MAAKDDGNSNAQESEESIPLETNPAISTTTIDIDPTDIHTMSSTLQILKSSPYLKRR